MIDIELTEENISTAAKLTFLNVILLTAVFTLLDAVRRKITVERPVRRILEASEKIIQGGLFGENENCFGAHNRWKLQQDNRVLQQDGGRAVRNRKPEK